MGRNPRAGSWSSTTNPSARFPPTGAALWHNRTASYRWNPHGESVGVPPCQRTRFTRVEAPPGAPESFLQLPCQPSLICLARNFRVPRPAWGDAQMAQASGQGPDPQRQGACFTRVWTVPKRFRFAFQSLRCPRSADRTTRKLQPCDAAPRARFGVCGCAVRRAACYLAKLGPGTSLAGMTSIHVIDTHRHVTGSPARPAAFRHRSGQE